MVKKNLYGGLLLAILVAFVCLPSLVVAAELEVSDCVKCHKSQPAEIEEMGAAHKKAINCQDCHTGHRPMSANNIPSCNNCHEGTPHFELTNCLTCHNPHKPLDVKLEGEIKTECLTCHQGPGQQMVANPSKHAEQSCNFCHAEKHGVIPNCVDCHDPHAETMTQADCATCHQAHQPLLLAYGANTPSTQCAACHDEALTLLTNSPAKHSALACATCHTDQHKMIPECSNCHGVPHAEGIHKKFPECGSCHNVAHDLNNWPDKK